MATTIEQLQIEIQSNSKSAVSGVDALTSSLGKLRNAVNGSTSSTKSLGNANDATAKSYVNLGLKVGTATLAMRKIARVVGSWIAKSNDYIETMNLFTVSMGGYAAEAEKYANQVSEIMGLDPSEWMKNQAVFMTLATGFGVASDRAYTMSQNLTQLGYDIASFRNLSFEEAFQKLQSGLAGELEPLRRIGYDLSIARLQQEAYTLGIEKKVSAMTQAEKAELRYYAIMTQVTTAQGDMARTLNAPANQLRVLKSQLTQCGRALGNIFIPALNAVLPYAIAFVKVVRLIAESIASIFGFTLPEVDWDGVTAAVGGVGDGVDDVGKGLDKATDKAKELKNALLGIDELNVISKPEDSPGGGGGGGSDAGVGVGGGLGFELPTYDFIGDAVKTRADEIVEKIKESLAEITAIVSGALLAIGTILVLTGTNIPLGLGLMAVGAIGLAATTVLNWNGMSDNLARTLSIVTATIGGFLLAIGAALLFTGVNIPLGAGLMVAGAASLGAAVAINWKYLRDDMGNSLSVLTAVVSGALLAMGAIFAFTGVAVGLGIGLMIAGAAGLATAVGLNWDSLSPEVKAVITDITSIVGGALLALGAVLAFTGVSIPLGIAMMAAGAISIASAVALNWGGLNGDLKGSLSKITGIVIGASLGIGAILVLTGVAAPLGMALMAAGATALIANAVLNWDSITTKISDVLKDIGIAAGAAMLALGVLLCLSGVGIPLGIGLILAGAGSLVAGVSLNWDSITNYVSEGLNNISEKFGEFKENVNKKLEETKETIQTWSSNTVEWFTKGKDGKNVIDHFKEIGSDIVGEFKGSIDSKNGSSKSSVITWGSLVKTWFTGTPFGAVSVLTFGKFASDIITGFKNKIGNKYTDTKSPMSTWASKVKSWFSSDASYNNFASMATDVINGFKDKIGNTYTTVSYNMKTFASNVKTWFTDKVSYSSFYNLASDVINGFKEGIGNLYETCKNTIKNWGSDTIDWFAKVLDINSPSRVFYQMANFVIQGFNNGITTIGKTTKGVVGNWADSFTSVTPTMSFAVDTSALRYYNSDSFARSVSASVTSNNMFTATGFIEGMGEFYREYVEPTMAQMAADMRRQADKDEHPVVQIGNRTVSEAVTTQQRANGYVFAR